MLSVDCCHEPAPLPESQDAEPVCPVPSLRRLNINFAPDSHGRRGGGSTRRNDKPAVSIPTFSRIIFRAGAVSVR